MILRARILRESGGELLIDSVWDVFDLVDKGAVSAGDLLVDDRHELVPLGEVPELKWAFYRKPDPRQDDYYAECVIIHPPALPATPVAEQKKAAPVDDDVKLPAFLRKRRAAAG